MGKKKDKVIKSKKKKSEAKSEVETEPETIEHAEPELEPLEYAEYVTAQDVMELVNSLSHDLEQLGKSNQSLQQQLADNQKSPQRLYPVLMMIITITLGIGIVTVGYYGTRINASIDENMGTTSNRIDKIKIQVDAINTTMSSIPGDLNQLNIGLSELSANISTIDQSISKVANNVNKINTNAASISYDPRYISRPIDPMSPWR